MNIYSTAILTVLMAALALVFFYLLHGRTLQRAIVSVVRFIVQTALVGACVYALLRIDHVLLNLLWLVLTVTICAWYVVLKAHLRRNQLLPTVWAGMLLATVVSMLPFYSLGKVHQAALFVPVSGILLTVMSALLPKALKEYFVALVRFSDTYYYLLAGGTSWFKAVVPMLRRAVDRSFLPFYRRLSLAGIVGLPLLLAGQLLAGVEPLAAVAATLLLTFSALVATLLALLFVVVASRHLVSDKRGHLTDIVRL